MDCEIYFISAYMVRISRKRGVIKLYIIRRKGKKFSPAGLFDKFVEVKQLPVYPEEE